MVNAATGALVGGQLGGAVDGVDISFHLNAMTPRRSYVHLHTHPGSSSFSHVDAGLLVTYQSLHTLMIVGADGTWYLLTKRPGVAPASVEAVGVVYHHARVALRPRYRALVLSGAMTTDAAWREHSHAIWRAIAHGLGLRYDRVETG